MTIASDSSISAGPKAAATAGVGDPSNRDPDREGEDSPGQNTFTKLRGVPFFLRHFVSALI